MSKTAFGSVIASPSIPQDKLREAIPKVQLVSTVEIAEPVPNEVRNPVPRNDIP
jgi:hypothetical protein